LIALSLLLGFAFSTTHLRVCTLPLTLPYPLT
jgi:hypothetical protein